MTLPLHRSSWTLEFVAVAEMVSIALRGPNAAYCTAHARSTCAGVFFTCAAIAGMTGSSSSPGLIL